MARRTDAATEARACELIVSGMTYKSVARETGVSASTAREIAVRHGLREAHARASRRLTEDDEAQIVAMVREQRLKYREIGEMFGVSGTCVSGIADRNDARRRTNSPWTTGEMEFVRRHYRSRGARWVHEKLGTHTVGSIQQMARRMGVHGNYGRWAHGEQE